MTLLLFFFFNDTATTEIYTLSLHDALPIYLLGAERGALAVMGLLAFIERREIGVTLDRKSTRLNSSHPSISYAVFCLKKKKKQISKHPAQSTPKSSPTYNNHQ